MGGRDAHYAGGLVDGARMLELFGDVATELCIRADGDEGLFRAYDAVEFLAPVRAGDFIEAEGRIVGWGTTSLKMEFEARKVIVPTPARADSFASSADVLERAEVVCRASGTCVVPRATRRAAQFGRPRPCVITAAIVGAETTRAQNPHLPLSADELGEEAASCAAAGASVIHLHARDDEGRASQDTERFRAAVRAIRARCDVIVQTSTGGAVGMSVAERAGPLALTGADAPEMATLNVGTINFGDDVFMNRAADTVEMAGRIRAHGATPEIEIYDAGHVDIAARLLADGHVAAPLHFQFVLGVAGALSASARNLEFLVERVEALGVPFSWGVAGVGRHQLPMADLAITWGGNARVGLEDNIYLEKGVLAEGSAPLVARAVELCRARGRQVASVAEARALLAPR
ncbi:MAG TPA: 3-keto-5-aminohexanoate cleavage protein [Polyangia bacterium]|nr:3-keto-5-aminohexanoate cleavage protein [Polyangia bacterium]